MYGPNYVKLSRVFAVQLLSMFIGHYTALPEHHPRSDSTPIGHWPHSHAITASIRLALTHTLRATHAARDSNLDTFDSLSGCPQPVGGAPSRRTNTSAGSWGTQARPDGSELVVPRRASWPELEGNRIVLNATKQRAVSQAPKFLGRASHQRRRVPLPCGRVVITSWGSKGGASLPPSPCEGQLQLP
jgi:hypothetical protein